MNEPYLYVYVVTRAGKLQGLYKTLELAQSVYPGTWHALPHASFKAPDEWALGDAHIHIELVRGPGQVI